MSEEFGFDSRSQQRWRDAVNLGNTLEGYSEWMKMNAAPKGCACDPADWSVRPIPKACAEFKPDRFGTCTNCEHDKECHQ